jgi:hypothetical protein
MIHSRKKHGKIKHGSDFFTVNVITYERLESIVEFSRGIYLEIFITMRFRN